MSAHPYMEKNRNGVMVWVYPSAAEKGAKVVENELFFPVPRKSTEHLPIYILAAKRQINKVRRLVDYCRTLDGTEVGVIVLPTKIDRVPHPFGTELAIRYAGSLLDEPWIYLEADSIPTKPGWAKAITQDYVQSGKAFLLPDMTGWDEWDVASAIGVYPARADQWLTSADPTKPPWFDLWLLQNKREHIHFSKLIQHKYGWYNGTRHCERRCQFPLDDAIIKPETVIFHADPTQSLIRGGVEQSYFHSGDLGDIVAALPIIRQQGGGHLVLGPNKHFVPGVSPRVHMTRENAKLIIPLLLRQPYIKGVEWVSHWRKTDTDFSDFRRSYSSSTENLTDWQARAIFGRQAVDMTPWLSVDGDSNNRVIAGRSHRYHNDAFPWKEIAKKYGDQLLFVGLKNEHKDFEATVGRRVEHKPTADLLEAAQVIAGGARVFSNQTSLWWLAAGLGNETVQESWEQQLNSVFYRPGLSYTRGAQEILELKQSLA